VPDEAVVRVVPVQQFPRLGAGRDMRFHRWVPL
jgi:hypothetical protein